MRDQSAAVTSWVVGNRCSVRVPATSANLGPGFDSLGLALGLYDVVEAEIITNGLELTVDGEGADSVPLDRRHLVVQAFDAAVARSGRPGPPGLRLRAHNAIPHGRGLGSSAAAVVAGVSLAALLAPADAGSSPLPGDAIAASAGERLVVAGQLEGHPDNAAAAILGGLTISWCELVAGGHAHGGLDALEARAVRLQPHSSIEPVVLIPPHRLDTRSARAALPSVVPHADAARTAGRAALLVHALTTDPSRLMAATEDWLHQRQRRAAMPETLDVVDRLRARGLAAVVSGAGPSVLVLSVGAPDGSLGAEVQGLLADPPPGWRAAAPGIAHQGTRGGVLGTRI